MLTFENNAGFKSQKSLQLKPFSKCEWNRPIFLKLYMESRAALAGNSVFHNKKISFKLVIPPSCFHTLALGDFLIFDVAYTFETQTNAIGLQDKAGAI